MEKNSLSQEINRIQNTQLREALMAYFKNIVPDYFWTVPSSSSGKFHSSFDSGEGGLVRHTKMCVLVAEELLRLEEFSQIDPDCMYAAMLLHDSFKQGRDGRHYRADHPRLAADAWRDFAKAMGLPENITMAITYAIAWHSGQWSGPSTRDNFEKPNAYMAEIKCAHLCDYIASRGFFNKINTL